MRHNITHLCIKTPAQPGSNAEVVSRIVDLHGERVVEASCLVVAADGSFEDLGAYFEQSADGQNWTLTAMSSVSLLGLGHHDVRFSSVAHRLLRMKLYAQNHLEDEGVATAVVSAVLRSAPR